MNNKLNVLIIIYNLNVMIIFNVVYKIVLINNLMVFVI